jgi:predicted phosphodiesterase
MNIAVISDIHANYEALQAVLADIRRRDIKEIWCLGDLVGYGPEPNKVIDYFRQNKILTLKGNHDAALLGELDLDWFNIYAQYALLWAKKEITSLNKNFLKKLPLQKKKENCLLVHGSLREPLTEYILEKESALKNLLLSKSKILLIGHSHIPFLFSNNGFLSFSYDSPIFLIKDQKYLINPGSVGQPRDRDNRASWLELNLGSGQIIFHRCSYNWQKTQLKMKKLKFPLFLIQRLKQGI